MNNLFKILPIILGAGFIFFGIQKFGASNPVFEIIAERSNIALFEPTIRRLTGVGELITGVLLIIPSLRLRKLGVLSGLMILLGAIGFHLSPWLGINVPGIGHGLFITAVIMAIINLILTKHFFGKTLTN